MRTRTAPALLLSALLTGGPLLTACGTQSADGAGAGAGGRTGSVPGDPADLAKDGVRVTALSGWSKGTPPEISAAYELTSREREPFTYTFTLDVLSAAGEGVAHAEHTVAAVAPGRTVTGTVRMSAQRAGVADAAPGRVRITKVRRVPTAEAPAAQGPCPSSGVRVTSDDGDAAMGLRVLGLRLENCGTRPYEVNGYPALELLDADGRRAKGVEVRHGGAGIALVTGFDAAPRPFTLQPGETASAGLMWRNTTTSGDAVNLPYVRVTARPGAAPVRLTPELDLGTTGRAGVSAWQKDTKGSKGSTGAKGSNDAKDRRGPGDGPGAGTGRPGGA
ncbi:DUF4232 domain-containing protein [Streptomyces sp. cg36]|uniref:DUF4232 domain-containing protein n=1 Tax=Streptomyces sp. cg36 TaxID=3238798 RepID=UPI0034E2D36D